MSLIFDSILTKSDLLSEDLIEVPNINCNENSYFGSRVVLFGDTNERTDRE
jgi:hypothetical protein